jgi:AraC-like DNA-binding protein
MHFLNIKTKAYFSVQSINDFRKESSGAHPQKWFSVLINTSKKAELVIDDNKLLIERPTAIFVTPGQYVDFSDDSRLEGYAVSFNQEFYCIEYHDSEISCKGLLFVNNYGSVLLNLDIQQVEVFRQTAEEMISELRNETDLQDEMLVNLLKNLLIRSSRLFRAQLSNGELDDENIDFGRKFSDLVEKYYKKWKQVDKYAEMLGIAPASLTKKLQKYGVDAPSKTIKNRVVTEAKRLLLYTNLSVKEIAHALGYEDQFYFSRLFAKEAGLSPSEYKKNQRKI